MIDFPLAIVIFGQEAVPADIAVIGLLIVLEGLLSIDNALVLGMLARRLPKHMRARALSYGLIGAFVFRVAAIIAAGFLLKFTFVKFLGGGYLVYMAVSHLLSKHSGDGEAAAVLESATDLERDNGDSAAVPAGAEYSAYLVDSAVAEAQAAEAQATQGEAAQDQAAAAAALHRKHFWLFWRTVLVIELTDIAFAVDSILAALALAGSRPEKLWVVITGGIIGVVLMRFAAVMFVSLLERFPRFEVSAYLLVLVIGLKLLGDWAFNSDWSYADSQWMLDSLKPMFESIESARLSLIAAYENWLHHSWPLDIGDHDDGNPVPKLLDFHNFRRPECSGFWLTMMACFAYGFTPKKGHQPPADSGKVETA